MVDDPSHPSPEAALLPTWSRETQIRRDRHGRWWDGAEPIQQPAIEQAFDRWIDVADDGRYILKNSVNWAYVTVEGAPLFVRQVVLDDEGAFLVLSDRSEQRLDPRTLRIDRDGVLYASARATDLPARFDGGALLALSAAATDQPDGRVGLVLGGRLWLPTSSDTPLARPWSSVAEDREPGPSPAAAG